MAPREANNPYPDQYLTIEFDATAMMMPHDGGGGGGGGVGVGPIDIDTDTGGDNNTLDDNNVNLNTNIDIDDVDVDVDTIGIDDTDLDVDLDLEGLGMAPPPRPRPPRPLQTTTTMTTTTVGDQGVEGILGVIEAEDASLDDDDDDEDEDDQSEEDDDNDNTATATAIATAEPPAEVHLPSTTPLTASGPASTGDTTTTTNNTHTNTLTNTLTRPQPQVTPIRPTNNNNNNNNNNRLHRQQQQNQQNQQAQVQVQVQAQVQQPRGTWNLIQRNRHHHHNNNHTSGNSGSNNRLNHRIMSSGSADLTQTDIDPLAIDMTEPEEEEIVNRAHTLFVNAAMASSQIPIHGSTTTTTTTHGSSSHSHSHSHSHIHRNRNRSRSSRTVPVFNQASRQVSSDSADLTSPSANANTNVNANASTPTTHRRRHRGTLISPTTATPTTNDTHIHTNTNTTTNTNTLPLISPPSPIDSYNINMNNSSNANSNTNSNTNTITTTNSQQFRRALHRQSLSSVLDQDPSISDDEQEDDDDDDDNDHDHTISHDINDNDDSDGVPDLDTTLDTSDISTAPNTPQTHHPSSTTTSGTTTGTATATATATGISTSRFTLSPVRRLIRGESNLFNSQPTPAAAVEVGAAAVTPSPPSTSATAHVNVVTDEETNSQSSNSFNLVDYASATSSPSSYGVTAAATAAAAGGQGIDIDLPPSPQRLMTNHHNMNATTNTTHTHIRRPPARSVSNTSNISAISAVSAISTTSGRSIRWTTAFESGLNLSDNFSESSSSVLNSRSSSTIGNSNSIRNNHSHGNGNGNGNTSSSNSNQIDFSFGSDTNVADLKYFAERGCIVQLLRALDTPRLKTLGTRMLADYAKMPHRRVAVASNKRILEFCCRTMLEMPSDDHMGTEWPAREYAVETIRSLTATEDSDSFLMGCTGLLKALAIVVRGGPFYDILNVATVDEPRPVMYHCDTTVNKGLVSGKARLHACIAIMNLSCGKANKITIASIPEVLEAMRDVMVALPEHFSPATSSPPVPNTSSSTATPLSVSEEARLKAATCIKNLSNADANDASLLGADGLIEALAHAAVTTCTKSRGATHCTTNACLALMNLSISKANKHRVFKTKGVMNALMTVLDRTSPSENETRRNSNNEARVKACSALSNLAIGYENKIPMFAYDGFVDAILQVIETDTGEARTKACSILWSFAAEMKNQVPVVMRGDILPTLVRVAEEDHSTEARFKCVAALTLLAESLENALPLLASGALHPLMDILHEAGADPTQWKGQTASWCVGFLMNMAQSDDAAPHLREAGVVELLAPLLTLEHYQSLKAAMAVTFICRFDKDDETYDLLRKTENVIPKIIRLLHNTLSGRGGNGYKYGVFTLRSSVGCISSLASGPEFMKERIATKPVFESLLCVINDFCVNGGTKGAIVGGGRDDALSATLAIRALQSLTEYMIPIPGSSALPFGAVMDKNLMVALESLSECDHHAIKDETRKLARDGSHRIEKSLGLVHCTEDNDSGSEGFIPRRNVANNIIENSIVASLVQGCCIGPSLTTGYDGGFFPSMIRRPLNQPAAEVSDASEGNDSSECGSTESQEVVRTFLLTDSRTGRLFAVPRDPSGGRAFNDGRQWCYRRGRYCRSGEVPDPNFRWTEEMHAAYSEALQSIRGSSASQGSSHGSSINGAQPVAPAGLK